MTFTIRCLTGSKELWAESFEHQKDAEFYYPRQDRVQVRH